MIEFKILGLRSTKGRFASMEDRGLVEHQLVTAHELAQAAAAIYRDHAPVATGEFRDSIEGHASERVGGFEAGITTGKPLVRKWLKEGTGIYGPTGERIFPKNGPLLVFEWPAGPPELAGADGKFRFRSIAGMKPNPWERMAEAEAMPLLSIEARKLGVRVARGLAGAGGE